MRDAADAILLEANNAAKYRGLRHGIQFLAASFGAAEAEEFRHALGPEGPAIADGLVSQGWARFRAKHGDYVITEAGQRADAATSDLPLTERRIL
jgi:hypothetical protein